MTNDELTARLAKPRFPRSSRYDGRWVVDNLMGPNVLWITEYLSEAIAVAAIAIDLGDVVVGPDVLNAAALRQAVQHALLQFRDVHENRLSSHRTPLSAAHGQQPARANTRV